MPLKIEIISRRLVRVNVTCDSCEDEIMEFEKRGEYRISESTAYIHKCKKCSETQECSIHFPCIAWEYIDGFLVYIEYEDLERECIPEELLTVELTK